MSTWASWLVIVALMGLTAGVVLVGERSHWWVHRRRLFDWERECPELAKGVEEHSHVRVRPGYRPAPPPEPDSL